MKSMKVSAVTYSLIGAAATFSFKEKTLELFFSDSEIRAFFFLLHLVVVVVQHVLMRLTCILKAAVSGD